MPADLFNERTVEELSRGENISAKQKSRAYEWLMQLKAEQLTAERKNYIKFANTVLRDILGYPEKEIEESFETGGVEFLFKDDNGEKVVCFELKGSDRDLFLPQHREKTYQETPIKQTWDYMGKHNLKYGVATNFREFVLIPKEGYEKVYKFDFTQIEGNEDKIKEFVYFFSRKNLIIKEFVEKVEEKSARAERDFSNDFYKLYHETRLMLIKEFEESSGDRLKTIHYAQMFLNRLMFILFAKDTGLLDREILIRRIEKIAPVLEKGTSYTYMSITGLFGKLDSGDDDEKPSIYGFNGELFSKPIPAEMSFKDKRPTEYFKECYKQSGLKKEAQKRLTEHKILSKLRECSPLIQNIAMMALYDFSTEIRVNILGHIFEQSITDLEQLIEGETSKRKKEGIYYTPEYITDYICRNTIIPYLSGNNATTVEELIEEHKGNIEALEKKFKSVKILDPACGSGAFLIKAVDIMLEIYQATQEYKQKKGKYVQEVRDKKGRITGSYESFEKGWEQDEAREIIQNSIHGVDINEESVEITKLSLFLKIAREQKKLLDLSPNIKCGNSLIDDKEADPKNAFKWEEGFPQIIQYDKEGKLKEGYGFDIVIGNPPYVKARANEKVVERKFIESKFKTPYKMWDLYIPFVERGLSLLREDGNFSMIIPDTIGKADYTSKLTKFILDGYHLYQIDYFPESYVFENVGIKNKIIFVSNKKEEDKTKRILHLKEIVKTKTLAPKKGLEAFLEETSKVKFDFENIVGLGDICYISYGLRLNSDKDDKKYKFKKENLLSETETNIHKKCYTEGKYLERYSITDEKFVEWDTERCPTRLVRPTFPELYPPPKLLLSRQKRIATLDEKGHICDNTIIVGVLYNDLKGVDNSNIRKYFTNIGKERGGLEEISKKYNLGYLLVIINSRLMSYFLKFNSKGKIDTYPDDWKKIPIKNTPLSSQISLAEKSRLMLEMNKKLYNKKDKFISRLKSKHEIQKPSSKIDSFWELSFEDFTKEAKRLAKLKLETSLEEKRFDEYWSGDFEETKKELQELKQKIDETDREIDEMVYKLYGLTPEEIKIIESSV